MEMNHNALEEFEAFGLTVVDVQSPKFIWSLQDAVKDVFQVEDLSDLHKVIELKHINELRIKAFHKINALAEWDVSWHSFVAPELTELLGPDLLIQRKLNLSIQCPFDHSSQLGLHTDTLSGQSPFELVTWLPLCRFEDEAGMYWFDRHTSAAMTRQMAEHEQDGLELIREQYWAKRRYVKIEVGQIALFTGTIFHGNMPHNSTKTRVSVNCRFKSLYSPESRTGLNERGVGTFYKLLKSSAITRIASDYINLKVTF